MSATNGKAFDFFECFQPFVEGGWMARLAPAESAVYLGFLACANKDTGIAWPGVSWLAKRAGVTSRAYIRAIRKRLVTLKLLEPVEVGTFGTVGTSARYRVLPPPSSLGATSHTAQLVTRRSRKSSRGATSPSHTAQRGLVTRRDTEHPIEHSNEHSTNTPAGGEAADVVGSVSLKDERREALKRELLVHGVNGRAFEELSAGGFSAVTVRLLAIEAAKVQKKPGPGLLLSYLESDSPPPTPLNAQRMAELVRQGHVVSIDGHAVGPGLVKFSGNDKLFVYLREPRDGDASPPVYQLQGHEIRLANVELSTFMPAVPKQRKHAGMYEGLTLDTPQSRRHCT